MTWIRWQGNLLNLDKMSRVEPTREVKLRGEGTRWTVCVYCGNRIIMRAEFESPEAADDAYTALADRVIRANYDNLTRE